MRNISSGPIMCRVKIGVFYTQGSLDGVDYESVKNYR